MAGFTPLPYNGHIHPQPELPPLSGSHTMTTCERALQYQLKAQEQHIRHLEIDNMRLKVKLEQAEKDINVATNMIMVACRSGHGSVNESEDTAKTRAEVERPRTPAKLAQVSPSMAEAGWRWGGNTTADRNGDSYRHTSTFRGLGGDAQGATVVGCEVSNGWGVVAKSTK